MSLGFHMKCTVFSLFQPNLEFLNIFSCKSLILNFTEICPVAATLVHVERRGWVDMTKLWKRT